MNFTDFFLPEPLLRGLGKLGWEEPTAVQSQVIPLAMERKDLLVSAATGSGKTAAFLLPMLQRFLDQPSHDTGTRGLILVPTRELARQIYDHFIGLASFTRMQAGVITGGAPKAHQIATLRKNPDILIATPGRLLELLELNQVALGDLEVLVLDEADRMLDMGFSEDVLRIIAQTHPQRHAMLFSATLHHRGLAPITEKLLREPAVVIVNPVREQHPDIRQQIIPADDFDHKDKLLAWLLANETFSKALVFTNTRERTEELANLLRTDKVRTAALHGELEQRERNRVMGLLRGGQINVLVATDLAARGLDVQGIDLVINYEMARNGGDYVHRIGRTGRAGEQGLAISLIAANEWNRMIGIERYLNLEFERRTVKELQGSFAGPKRMKRSGKAVGKKKEERPEKKEKVRTPKVRERERKNVGKRRAPSAKVGEGGGVEAGHVPPKKKI